MNTKTKQFIKIEKYGVSFLTEKMNNRKIAKNAKLTKGINSLEITADDKKIMLESKNYTGKFEVYEYKTLKFYLVELDGLFQVFVPRLRDTSKIHTNKLQILNNTAKYITSCHLGRDQWHINPL